MVSSTVTNLSSSTDQIDTVNVKPTERNTVSVEQRS